MEKFWKGQAKSGLDPLQSDLGHQIVVFGVSVAPERHVSDVQRGGLVHTGSPGPGVYVEALISRVVVWSARR